MFGGFCYGYTKRLIYVSFSTLQIDFLCFIVVMILNAGSYVKNTFVKIN
jgi:hypothetical protein